MANEYAQSLKVSVCYYYVQLFCVRKILVNQKSKIKALTKGNALISELYSLTS